MSWLKKIFWRFFNRNNQNSVPGKSFDDLYSYTGLFQYQEKGFSVSSKNMAAQIEWCEIDRIDVYKRDLMTTDLVVMQLTYTGKVLQIHEEMAGWYQFVIKTKEVFSEIPEDWDIEIIQPAFAENFRTIYKRS